MSGLAGQLETALWCVCVCKNSLLAGVSWGRLTQQPGCAAGVGAVDVFTGVCEQQLGDGSILTLLAGGRWTQLEQLFPLAALIPPCRRLFPVRGGEGQTRCTREEFLAVA